MVKDEQEWRREGSGGEDEQKKGGRGWGWGRRRDAQVGRRETGHKRGAVTARAYTLTHTNLVRGAAVTAATAHGRSRPSLN